METTTVCYNKGLGRDEKRRTVDSSKQALSQPRDGVTDWSILQLLTDHWLVSGGVAGSKK